MGYLIGIDEAGYGPNYGPLVVAASVWHVPDGVSVAELYARLAHVVSPAPDRNGHGPSGRVAMADSKRLYQAGKGLRHLERGLWAALAVLDRHPATWREMWRAIAPGCVTELLAAPWHAAYDMPLPVDATAAELEPLAAALRRGLAAAEVRLVQLAGRAVFPAEFNDLLDRHQSKGTALSHVTLQLLGEVAAPLGDGPISVVCDKHGGRNCYAPLLSEHFSPWLIEIHGEGRQQSVYRFGPHHRRVEVCFCAKAESYLPVALASMTAKYLRELSMGALNAYWGQRVAGLEPTAGYPEDARRFRADIATAQAELGIEDRTLWRAK